MPVSNSNSVLIIAAEASSSLYAQRILEHWKENDKHYDCFGVGSDSMKDLGFRIFGRSEDMAVVGIQEVLKNYSDIKSVFYKILEEVDRVKPKVALLLDYPEFNMKLAKELKKRNIPVVYYISPQIWAWRQGRVKKIQKYVDKMLLLFPFEQDFYSKHKVNVEFVGHPLLDELKEKLFDPEWVNDRRQRYGILREHHVLALMPGSRNSEIKYNLQIQLQTAQLIHKKDPKIKIMLLVAPSLNKQNIQALIPENYNVPLIVVQDEPFSMIAMADTVLCASGTATMMVGLMHKPMVIMYIMNSITAWIAKKLVTSTKYFGMINLILEDEVCKEHFQEQASPELLSESLLKLIQNPEHHKNIKDQLAQTASKLGDTGVTQRVCESLKPYLETP